MARTLEQANPTLDKIAERLELAGAGALGAILKGLSGTVEVTIEKGEFLDHVKIFSQGINNFSRTLTGTYTSLGKGRRKWSSDIVFGVDTDFGFVDAPAVRNYLQWQVRKKMVANPSGPLFDEPTMRRKVEADLRIDRDFFTPRTYVEDLNVSVSDIAIVEASGLAFRDDTESIYIVSDNGWMKVVDRDGIGIGIPVQLSNYGTLDPEAITYMGSDRFAVLDEGSVGVRAPRLFLFHHREGMFHLFDDIQIYILSDITEFSGGRGAEGLAYDRANDVFYVGTQPVGSGEGGLWKVDYKNKNTDNEPTQTKLFDWFDALTSQGHLTSSALFADMHYSRRLADGQFSDSLFCLFNNQGTSTDDPGDRVVIQIDAADGRFISKFTHALAEKWEGFCFNDDREEMYFVREGVGNNFKRFAHRQFDEAEIFRRQFYVKELPTKNGMFVNNQEAQLGEAFVFVNSVDVNQFAKDASLGINILPRFSDEFFLQHEYEGDFEKILETRFLSGVLVNDLGKRQGNQWANTLRNFGGAKTIELFLDNNPTAAVAEMAIEDFHGYYWASPAVGSHTIVARLRAKLASSDFVDITGHVRMRQISCP